MFLKLIVHDVSNESAHGIVQVYNKRSRVRGMFKVRCQQSPKGCAMRRHLHTISRLIRLDDEPGRLVARVAEDCFHMVSVEGIEPRTHEGDLRTTK